MIEMAGWFPTPDPRTAINARINNIRRCAEEALDLVDRYPTEAVLAAIAEMRPETHQAFCAALRYPEDNHRVLAILEAL